MVAWLNEKISDLLRNVARKLIYLACLKSFQTASYGLIRLSEAFGVICLKKNFTPSPFPTSATRLHWLPSW